MHPTLSFPHSFFPATSYHTSRASSASLRWPATLLALPSLATLSLSIRSAWAQRMVAYCSRWWRRRILPPALTCTRWPVPASRRESPTALCSTRFASLPSQSLCRCATILTRASAVHRCLAETSFYIMFDYDLFQSTMSLFSIQIGTLSSSSSSISILIRSLKHCN
jgi:hypothetical protein